MNAVRAMLNTLVLASGLAVAPMALAACPPNALDCDFSLKLTVDTAGELGGDVSARWDLGLGRLGTAPVTIGAKLSQPFLISDGLQVQPPKASVNIQVIPSIAGYPFDVGLDLSYERRKLGASAYVGPITVWTTGDREWSAAVTIFDSKWFHSDLLPPVGYVPRFDEAELTLTPTLRPVPEPRTTSLLVVGLLGIGTFAGLRRRAMPARAGSARR